MTHRGNRGTPLNPNAWWYRASDEQRLVQVDAAIELELPLLSMVRLFGARSAAAVQKWAAERGRYFHGHAAGQRRRAARTSARAAYFRGESVDLWSEGAQDRSGRDEAEELVLE